MIDSVMISCDYLQITSLPPTIGALRSLASLDCSYNQLEHLPAEIGGEQIEFLYVQGFDRRGLLGAISNRDLNV